MAKVTGSYASLVRGVSQQAPADRLDGQHGEQINMLSDPVRGLVRRNGSMIEDQIITPVAGNPGYAVADSFSFRTFSLKVQDREIDLIYRSRPRFGSGASHLDGLLVFDKTADSSRGFVPVVTDPDDVAMAAYLAGGFSAMTTVGTYVLMAGNRVAPTYELTDNYNNPSWKNAGVAWVRGGAYARTYTIKATRASTGITYTATHTTMTAAYPEDLDTSGVPYDAEDYQKQINDLTYAYNAAVNQWISDASASIVPSAIAQGLKDELVAVGWPEAEWVVNGSHLGGTNVSHLEVSDGGDGSLLVSLLGQTYAADEVTDMHFVGKVIKVKPKTAQDEAYYLKAYANDESADVSLTGLRPVVWREAAGVTQTPTHMFAVGLLYDDKFFAAGDPDTLQALILDETGDTVEVPEFVASLVGDTESAPPPYFYGKTITAMTVFQDRLIVVSDSVMNASRPGDYFNFYRASVLTVADDDPVEAFALGSEGDTIRQAAVYDRNLLMLGDKHHYAIPGRTALTPTGASITVLYSIDNTAGALPVSTGQYVFSLKEDSQLAACRLLQTQAGVFQDSPQIMDVSRQLREYINGTPAELVLLTSPDMVFVRTEHFLRSSGAYPRPRPYGIYVYQFLDAPDGSRVVDSWSSWEFSTALGTPIGMSGLPSGDGIMLYTLAWGTNEAGVPSRGILALSMSARSDPTGMPYLDGMRIAPDAQANGLFTPQAAPAVRDLIYTAAGSAYSNPKPLITDADRFAGLDHPHYTVGDAPAETADVYRWTGALGHFSQYVAAYPDGNRGDLWTGLRMPAYVDLTPPFVRDSKGKAKTWGRLILSRLRVTLTRSAGFEASYIDHAVVKRSTHFAGDFERLRYGTNVWIGRDAREAQVRLSAIDWLPLTINAIEWAGQWFEPLKRR
jgi:hypothetical protein